jgi:hypothetical protein
VERQRWWGVHSLFFLQVQTNQLLSWRRAEISKLFLNNQTIQKYSLCIAGNQSWLFIIIPSPKIYCKILCTANSSVKYEIYSSAPGRPDDPLWVLNWLSISGSCDWCWVRTKSLSRSSKSLYFGWHTYKY